MKQWLMSHPAAAALGSVCVVALVAVGVSWAVLAGGGGDGAPDGGDPPAEVAAPQSSTTSTTTVSTPPASSGGGGTASATSTGGVSDPHDDNDKAVGDRVSLAGPGGITLHGYYDLVDGDDWSIAVDGAEGSLAGVGVGEASGQIASIGGASTADVVVALPGHPNAVPGWDMSAVLLVTQGGSDLVGEVRVTNSRGANQITMVGAVAPDGSYSLTVDGSVNFAGSQIVLVGTYQGSAGAQGPEHHWSIHGSGGGGLIDGVPVTSISVGMSEADPGVTGSVRLELGGSSPLVVDTELTYLDEANWELRASGASPSTWTPAGFSSLSADTGGITGELKSQGGRVAWNLTSPMELTDEDLEMTGALLFRGAQSFRVTVDEASGSILGVPTDIDFGVTSGAIAFDNGKVDGSVLLTAKGELLVDMPDGWESQLAVRIGFSGEQSGLSTSLTVNYSMINGSSKLQLQGVIDSSSVFALEVGGWLTFAGAKVPFEGSYLSAGYVVDGVGLTEPSWSMSGDIAGVDGGSIEIGGGARFVGGNIGLRSANASAAMQAGSESGAQTLVFAAATPTAEGDSNTFSGQMEIQLSENDSFTLEGTVVYDDEDDWVLTVATIQGEPWSPPGMAGLTIGVDDFSGTITSEEGELTWNVDIAEVSWEDVTPGVTITTGFTLGTDCPLDEYCPETEGVFVGFHDGEITFPDDIPDMWLEGAFLSDGSWARFEAGPDDITFGPVEISDSYFTMWKGQRSDTFDANLEMPDLRSSNNDFGLEFCGHFEVEIPDIDTVESGGCVSWSPEGIVIGQVGTGGDIDDSGEHNGVRIGNIELQGFGWTDLDFEPSLVISGIELPLTKERNHLTAEMHIPAELMKATGNADSEASIGATGWFEGTDFYLLGHIDVSMRSGGFTLDSVSVEIGKDGDQFALGLGADATVSMSGNHFPVSAFVGVEAGGGSSEIVVRLSAKGAVNEDPDGGFEIPTLLPSGNFEPTYDSLLDGAFDTKPDPSLLTNGSFEDAVPSENLVPNADFEEGVGGQLFPEGDFEGGEAGNLLPNGDLEDTNVVMNGDFETGDTTGWTLTSSYTMGVLSATAPTEDEGDYVMEVRNGAASGNVVISGSGMFQDVHWPTTQGATYELSAWMRTPDSGSRSVMLFVDQKGTAPGCSTQSTSSTNNTYTVDGTWRKFTLPITGQGCRGMFTVTVNPSQGGAKVQVDALSFDLVSSPVVVDVPNTDRPWMRSTTGTDFEVLPSIKRSNSSDVALASDYGNPGKSLKSNGNEKWWIFNKGTYGDVVGDFEISYDVYFPSSSSRDMLDMGFWNTGNDGNNDATGYLFRVESSNNPSGFYKINKGSRDRISNDGNSSLKREVWHRVRLVAVGSTVTATIERLDTGEQVYHRTDTMPSGNRSGVFGQLKTNHGTSAGHRLDNFHVISGAASRQAVRFDPGSARTGNQYLAMSSPTSNWSMVGTSAEAPEAGQVYTYTAYIRASATISGQLVLETEGGTREVASTFVAAGSPGTESLWTRYSVTLPITKSGHTGLRMGFTGLSAASVELYVDDISLQEIGWGASPTTPASLNALVVEDESLVHSGMGSLFLADRSDGTSYVYRDLAAPEQGATYTAKVWLRSSISSNVGLRLTARGGTEETAGVVVTPTDQWQEFSVTLPVTGTGHTALRLAIGVRTSLGFAYVDDVVVSGEGTSVPQDPTAAWVATGSTFDSLPPITLSGSQVALVSDYGNPVSSLRSDGDKGYWQFNKGSYGDVSGDFDISYDVYFPESGSREMLDMGYWLTGSTPNETGYLFRVQSANDNGGFYRIDKGDKVKISSDDSMPILARDAWHRVRLTAAGAKVTASVTRIDTEEEIYSNSVSMPSGNRAGVFGQVDSSNGSSIGHRVDNFFVYKGSNVGPWPRVLDDPAGAHSGSGYLRTQNPAGKAQSASYWTNVAPTVGSTYVAKAWVKAPAGSATGSFQATTGAESASTPFTATGAWQEVTATLTVTKPATNLAVVVQNDTPGAMIDVDDVSLHLEGLTQRQPWVGASNPGGIVQAAVWSDPAKAHSGSSYMEAQATGAPGSVSSTAEGDEEATLYTALAWVRSATGASVSGSLELAVEGGGGTSRSTPFTAAGEWQPVYVTVPVDPGGVDALRTSVHISTLGSPLLIDDVALRAVPTWVPYAPAGVIVDEVVMLDGSAASGPGYMRVRSSGPGAGVTAVSPANVTAGSSYTVQAYVRSTKGTALAGRLELGAAGIAGEAASVPFTATAEWQHVEVTLEATKANTALQPSVELSQAGELDVDQITVTQDVIIQDDPWTVDTASGGSVSAVVYEDPEQAHDSSGLMVLRTQGPAGSGISHGIAHAPVPGAIYAGSAWVRSPSGAPVQGQFRVTAQGGGGAEATSGFVADGSWQQVSVRLPISGSHSSMRAALTVDTPGVELYVDDVKVQDETWTTYAPGGAQVTQTQVNSGERAESGNGYVTVSRQSGSEGGIQLDTPGNVANGTSQTVSAYVRSTDGGDVAGKLRLAATGGGADDAATADFTAGKDWKKVSLTVHVTHDGQTALRTQVLVDDLGVGLDVDSVTIGQEPLGDPDGITTPLPHPETGYAYLWDDAFGIKGAHLWSLTAQITVVNGSPGLGVGGTLYFDPTQMPGVLVGTDWLKADMTLNVSRAEPCMAFGFDGTGTNTRLEIDGGVFSTSRFMLGFAPRGCEVGDYVVAPGASLGFDTELGDSTIHLDLEIGRDDNDLPTFYTDMAVHDLVLAGTEYHTMQLLVDISAASSYVGFIGDFSLPMGEFYGDFELSVGPDPEHAEEPDRLHMKGDVSVTDWKLVGGSFDVDEFNYYQDLYVPFGAGACASFAAGTDGDMSMGGKHYVFDGDIALDCGVLKVLHIEFDYMKGGKSYRFDLDYDSAKGKISGGVGFKFERKTSWKHLFHRYSRHPKFQVDLDFSMKVNKPESAALKIKGKVSVSGGSGSLECSINTGKDDGCSIRVHINKFGGHTYKSSW